MTKEQGFRGIPGLPDGYELIGFRPGEIGEVIIDGDGKPRQLEHQTNGCCAIIRKSGIEVRFTIEPTPCGCTVTMVTPITTRSKLFLNGYGTANVRAKRWIDDQIKSWREYEKERVAGGRGDCPKNVFFIDGKLVEENGES